MSSLLSVVSPLIPTSLVTSHPWLAVVIAIVVPCTLTSLSVLYTHPNSPVRLLVVLLTGYLSYLRWLAGPHLALPSSLPVSKIWMINAAGTSYQLALHIAVLLLLVRPSRAAISGSFGKGLSLAHSVRGIGTKWEVKNVPKFPGGTAANPVPSRARFLARQVAVVVWAVLFLDALWAVAAATPREEQAKMFGDGPGLEWDWTPWRQTREQIVGRVVAVAFSWFFCARAFIAMGYNFASILFVGLGISDVRSWPPLFGSYKEAYTIRGVWGSYWHQMLRWDYTTIATFVTRDVLHLPKPSLVERYTHIMLVFGLSAVYHTALDAMLGIPLNESGAPFFFSVFPLAIMLEDGVQALWRRIAGDEENKSVQKSPYWRKAVGFIWVFGFFWAVLPAYSYTFSRADASQTWMVPFSVIQGRFDPGQTLGALLVVGAVLAYFLGAEI